MEQDGFLQGMHPITPTLQVQVMGAHTSPGRKIQCHPHGLFVRAIGGEMVVETE